MGKVYLAESAYLTEYKQQVAVKTLTTYVSSERQAALLRDLFTREANIQVQFKHPHIVSVIQFAVEEGQYFLILEYMQGYQHRSRRISNIADMIAHETGPMAHKRALRLFVQALDAMSYAHNFKYRWEGEERVGIVHRDIKPANLLVMDQDTIKVSDFGIVKVQQRAPAATQKLTPGTSAYMSPEAILGPAAFDLPDLDGRSDIYALGITLYEMLAGRLPFAPDPNTNVDVSLRRKHVHDAPPPPSAYYPGIPKMLDELVLKALEKRPENRYQTALEFKQAILALDSQLGLNLTDTGRMSEFATKPLLNPTEKIGAIDTAAGTTVLATTPGVPGKTFDAAATNLYEVQPATRPTVTPPHQETKSSNKGVIAVAAIALLAALAVGAFFFLRPSPTTATKNNNVTNAPKTTPKGMALIPAGSFIMGRNLTDEEKETRLKFGKGEIKIFQYDWPGHEVPVKEFYLAQTEVSNAEYYEFVKATGYAPPAEWNGPAPPPNASLIPVTGVTYLDAVEYCNWLTKQRNDGLTYRLPTEAEWEYAARGKDAGKPGAPVNLYPWGDEWIDGAANTAEARLEFPRNVDSYADRKSPFGILNLAGNVVEWTSTDFNHYPGSDQQTPREAGYQGTYQVVRGGGFAFPKEYAMTTTRVWARPDNKGPKLGFRCAADAKR